MATQYSKVLLSGSTSGRGIKVAAVATPGTLIHTAIAGATDFDEIWLWAVNHDTVARDLFIEFGGVTDPDDLMETKDIPPASGMFLVCPGIPLNGGLVVRAFADAAPALGEFVIWGYVNRIEP